MWLCVSVLWFVIIPKIFRTMNVGGWHQESALEDEFGEVVPEAEIPSGIIT